MRRAGCSSVTRPDAGSALVSSWSLERARSEAGTPQTKGTEPQPSRDFFGAGGDAEAPGGTLKTRTGFRERTLLALPGQAQLMATLPPRWLREGGDELTY